MGAGNYELIVFRDHDEQFFRDIWHKEYCQQRILTFDGTKVAFYDNQFDHAFYESSGRNDPSRKKDTLSPMRCARIRWIRLTLEDPTAELYEGYESKTHRQKRVAVVKDKYVVIIQIYAPQKARFITAYVADNSIGKIKNSPRWSKKKNAD